MYAQKRLGGKKILKEKKKGDGNRRGQIHKKSFSLGSCPYSVATTPAPGSFI